MIIQHFLFEVTVEVWRMRHSCHIWDGKAEATVYCADPNLGSRK